MHQRYQKQWDALQDSVLLLGAGAGPAPDILRGSLSSLTTIRRIQKRDHGRCLTCLAKSPGAHQLDDDLSRASIVLGTAHVRHGGKEGQASDALPSSQGIKSEYNILGSSTFSISCKSIYHSVFLEKVTNYGSYI